MNIDVDRSSRGLRLARGLTSGGYKVEDYHRDRMNAMMDQQRYNVRWISRVKEITCYMDHVQDEGQDESL